jgi:hypothetical protein
MLQIDELKIPLKIFILSTEVPKILYDVTKQFFLTYWVLVLKLLQVDAFGSFNTRRSLFSMLFQLWCFIFDTI